MLARITKHNVCTHTPWGAAQTATSYGKGLTLYSTASHGGFHVSKELLKQMPEYLQTADKYADGTAGWFEEDCAWCIVVMCFPDRFTADERADAVRVFAHTYREQYMRFTAPPTTPAPTQQDFGGAFDGFTVSSDADSGL